MKSSGNLLILFVVFVIIVAVTCGGHKGYYQYQNVPGWSQYEFGYHRGNPYHHISRHEQGHGWKFRTKVKWADKKGGYGEHYWDYNHVDKGYHKGKGWHGHGHGKGYGHGHGHGHGYGHGHGHHGYHSHPQPQYLPLPSQNHEDTYKTKSDMDSSASHKSYFYEPLTPRYRRSYYY